MSTDKLLTAGEVAKQLGMSKGFVYAEMNRGNLPYVRLGKKKHVLVADVQAYIEAARQGGREAAA